MSSNKLNTQFQSAKQSPGFLFWKISNLHQRLQRQELKDLDITPSQFSVLACYFFLAHSEPPTQSVVCEFTSMDKMHVSDITRALIKKKYIRKIKNSKDARSHCIIVTDLGADICNQSVKRIEKLDNLFFGATENISKFMEFLVKIESEFK